jgi:hypothetical protein
VRLAVEAERVSGIEVVEAEGAEVAAVRRIGKRVCRREVRHHDVDARAVGRHPVNLFHHSQRVVDVLDDVLQDAELRVECRSGEAQAGNQHLNRKGHTRKFVERMISHDGDAVGMAHGKRNRGAVEHPHQKAPVVQPAGRLDLAEIDRHHAPPSQSGAERIFERQFSNGVFEKEAAVFLVSLDDAGVQDVLKTLGQAVAPQRDGPQERSHDQTGGKRGTPASLERAPLAKADERNGLHAHDQHQKHGADLREIHDGNRHEHRAKVTGAGSE